MENWATLLREALESLPGEDIPISKGQVYLLPCGTKTYTWLIREGVFFPSLRVEGAEGELANTVWRKGWIIHSLDTDITLPAHAMTDGVLRKVDSSELNALIRGNAELGFALAEHYHAQFTRTLLHYRLAALEPSKQRLARFEEYFANIPELEGERIDDTTMSLFMGMHRVSVSRLRREILKDDEKCE